MRRQACGGVALIASFAMTNVEAQAPQRPPFVVSATWIDTAPTEVTFDERGQPTSLSKGQGQAKFEAQIARGPIGQERRGTLRASYGDGADVVIPIRLVEDRTALAIAFLRAAQLPCAAGELRSLEINAQDFQLNMKAYFQARELSTRTSGDDICGDWAKKRVRKAWVDRSYNLAVVNPQIRFDEQAAEALIKADPRQTAYVEKLRHGANDIRFQLLTSQKLTAIDNGDYGTASMLNGTLLQEVGDVLDSGKLQGPEKGVAGLSLNQLRKDEAYIQTLSASQ